VNSEHWPQDSLDARVRAKALACGFDLVGVARADEPLTAEHARYRAFVDAGMHGDMAWLADNHDVRRRLDGSGILEGARSVVCVARSYARPASDEAADPDTARAIARYARGRDYHNGIRKRLRRLAAFLRSLGTAAAPVEARPMIDDVPVLERAWAARAGLGFVGKNGMLIAPGTGSLLLLGEVVTTLPLTPDVPIDERCGACTRCLDACPTQAFVRPFVLDPRRCVSYLTIEKRGEVEEALRPDVGDHLFGCDDCQTVCPFNTRRPPRNPAPFAPHPRWAGIDPEGILALDEAAWGTLVLGSPVRRATREGLARNAAIVLGNRGDARALPALERAMAAHDSPVVREAAAWAVTRIRNMLRKSQG
jgi:epoxyqueuosine reductase